MMDRFRRILQRHPNDDEKTPLVPKEKETGQKVTSTIRKRVHKGYTKIPTARGKGRRKRASAIKAMSTIRNAIRRRKTTKRRRKTKRVRRLTRKSHK